MNKQRSGQNMCQPQHFPRVVMNVARCNLTEQRAQHTQEGVHPSPEIIMRTRHTHLRSPGLWAVIDSSEESQHPAQQQRPTKSIHFDTNRLRWERAVHYPRGQQQIIQEAKKIYCIHRTRRRDYRKGRSIYYGWVELNPGKETWNGTWSEQNFQQKQRC